MRLTGQCIRNLASQKTFLESLIYKIICVYLFSVYFESIRLNKTKSAVELQSLVKIGRIGTYGHMANNEYIIRNENNAKTGKFYYNISNYVHVSVIVFPIFFYHHSSPEAGIFSSSLRDSETQSRRGQSPRRRWSRS